jgi:hypothetical protein
MNEAQAITYVFELLAGENPFYMGNAEDDVRLLLCRAMAFYSKKPHHVDAFNSLVESLEHSINAKKLILGPSEEK